MQQTSNFMVVLSIVGLFFTSVSFAQQPGISPSRPSEQMPARESSEPQDTPAVPRASTFIGSAVENHQGEELGTIDDLVIDPMEGRITYAALSYGSILGLGGKLFAVSWQALDLQPDGKTFVLNVAKETLENSPGFDKSNWPQQPDPMLRAAAGKTAR